MGKLFSNGNAAIETFLVSVLVDLQLDDSSIRRIGPGWLQIIPHLSEQTWSELDEKKVAVMPWQAIVANSAKCINYTFCI